MSSPHNDHATVDSGPQGERIRTEDYKDSQQAPFEVFNPDVEATIAKLEQERQEADRIWKLCKTDPHLASPGSKYPRYDLAVDQENGDRALEIKLWSLQRPHMRALHCAWISFFLAFVVWVAPAPLLKEIQDSLGLTKQEVWTSSITNDCTAILTRIIVGPICDAYGARLPMSIVLLFASIPTAMLGFVDSAAGLAIIRFFIGFAGSSFVMAQYWPSRMFSAEIAGAANGIVGGWGNLGGGISQLMMGRFLFPLFKNIYNGDAEKSWRTICVFPAAIAFLWGCILPFVTDDAPSGNYAKMKKTGTMDRILMTTSLRNGATRNTWILYTQYACSFGVELAMNNAAVLYFTEEFGLTTETASTLGFAYGSMNIFARALGGIVSDHLNIKMGLRGRLLLQTVLLIFEGALIIVFANAGSLVGAVVTMCAFSVFTQSAEGAIYGVVPYVSKLYTGSVSGFVGSGGNVGSVVYGFLFRHLEYRVAFLIMGCVVIASSTLTCFVHIPCHAGLLWGEDNHAVIQARERYRQLQRNSVSASASTSTRPHGQPSEGSVGDQAPITDESCA